MQNQYTVCRTASDKHILFHVCIIRITDLTSDSGNIAINPVGGMDDIDGVDLFKDGDMLSDPEPHADEEHRAVVQAESIIGTYVNQ